LSITSESFLRDAEGFKQFPPWRGHQFRSFYSRKREGKCLIGTKVNQGQYLSSQALAVVRSLQYLFMSYCGRGKRETATVYKPRVDGFKSENHPFIEWKDFNMWLPCFPSADSDFWLMSESSFYTPGQGHPIFGEYMQMVSSPL